MQLPSPASATWHSHPRDAQGGGGWLRGAIGGTVGFPMPMTLRDLGDIPFESFES